MKDNYNDIYDLCKKHMHAYVLAEVVDGSNFDGIVTGLDDEYVYFAVPIEDDQQQELPRFDRRMGEGGRQYGYGHGHHGHGYPGPGYGGYPGYGYGGGPPRFRRLILPLTALAALSVLPWY